MTKFDSFLHLCENPLRFEPVSEVNDVFFDDANEQVFCVRSKGVTGVVVKGPDEKRNAHFTLLDKGSILCVKFSPDQTILAIQRSQHSVEFIHKMNDTFSSDQEYSQTCRAKSSKLKGFAWTGFGNDIIFVTDQGVELYSVSKERRLLRLLKSYSLQVNCSQGVVARLPKFEVDLPLVPKPPKLCLLDRDINLAVIYKKPRVVVLRHRVSAPKDVVSTTSGAAEIVIYTLENFSGPPKKTDILLLDKSGRFAVNFIDSLILVHHQSSKSSMVFDIALGGTKEGSITFHTPLVPPHPIAASANYHLYSPNWIVFQPDIIIDATLGLLWRLQLRFDFLASIIRPSEKMVDFILLRADCRDKLLKYVGVYLSEKPPLPQVATVMENISDAGYADDLCSQVFSQMQDETSSYNFGVLVEHVKSLHNQQLSPTLRELIVRNLVQRGLFYQLHQFLQYRILGDSKPLACLLLSLMSVYPASPQLALDMLKCAGGGHEETIEVLLSQKKVLSALRLVRATNNTDTVSSRKFLETAKQLGDPNVFYAVYQFFVQRNIKLRGSPQFPKGEMCQPYVAYFNELFGANDSTSSS